MHDQQRTPHRPRFHVTATFRPEPEQPETAHRSITITTEPNADVFIRLDLSPVEALMLAVGLAQGTEDAMVLDPNSTGIDEIIALMGPLAAVFENVRRLQRQTIFDYDRLMDTDGKGAQAWLAALRQAESDADQRERLAVIPPQ